MLNSWWYTGPMKISKKAILGGIILLLAVIVGSTVWWRAGSFLEFTSSAVTFKYPKSYVKQATAKAATNRAQVLISLREDDPVSSIELAQEKGAIIGANVTKTDFLTFLEGSAERGFPTVYKGYQKLKMERLEISGRSASVVSFSYTGAEKTPVYVNFFIMPLGNDAYYLRVLSVDQAKLSSDTRAIQKTLHLL